MWFIFYFFGVNIKSESRAHIEHTTDHVWNPVWIFYMQTSQVVVVVVVCRRAQHDYHAMDNYSGFNCAGYSHDISLWKVKHCNSGEAVGRHIAIWHQETAAKQNSPSASSGLPCLSSALSLWRLSSYHWKTSYFVPDKARIPWLIASTVCYLRSSCTTGFICLRRVHHMWSCGKMCYWMSGKKCKQELVHVIYQQVLR